MSDFRIFCVAVTVSLLGYLLLRLCLHSTGMMTLDEMARTGFIVISIGFIWTAFNGRRAA